MKEFQKILLPSYVRSILELPKSWSRLRIRIVLISDFSLIYQYLSEYNCNTIIADNSRGGNALFYSLPAIVRSFCLLAISAKARKNWECPPLDDIM